VSCRWSRPLQHRSIGDSADTAARGAGESSWLLIGPPSAFLGWQWRDGHRLHRFIDDEFQPADVAAVDSISLRRIAIVADLRLARRAFPGWHRPPREGIAATRPLNHARGWSNALAVSRTRNHVHFAAAVSFWGTLRCPIASHRRCAGCEDLQRRGGASGWGLALTPSTIGRSSS
jgi:hypothetical protein